MACHVMLKTYPLGLSHNKNLGLQPQFLSTTVPLGQVFNIAWPAMIKTFNMSPVKWQPLCLSLSVLTHCFLAEYL